MLFTSADGYIQLELPLGIVRSMRRLSTMAIAKETGGILIGSYSTDLALAIVARATAPPEDSHAGATWFERGTAGMNKLLIDAWSKGLHYLGEWHYHPGGDPKASLKDEAQMRKIAADKHARCNTPLLVILGGDPDKPQIAAYAQVNGSFLRLGSLPKPRGIPVPL